MYTISIPGLQDPIVYELASYQAVNNSLVNVIKHELLRETFDGTAERQRELLFSYLRNLNKRHFDIHKDGVLVFNGTKEHESVASIEPVHLIEPPKVSLTLEERSLDELLELQKQVSMYSKIISNKVNNILETNAEVDAAIYSRLSKYTNVSS